MRRIYRSDDDRLLAGVCGGMGEYFEVDPVIIRIAWIVVSLILGAGWGGVLLYFLAWILIPRRPWEEIRR